MDKVTLAKIAGLNTDKVDFALPQEYFDLLNKNHINTNLIVWSYEEKGFNGKPKHLGEEFIYNSQSKIEIDVIKLFKYMEEFKKEFSDMESFKITLMELINLLYDKKLLEYTEVK